MMELLAINPVAFQNTLSVLFWIGTVIGAGAVFFTYIIYSTAISNKIMTGDEMKYLTMGSKIITAGSTIVVATLTVLFISDPLHYLSSASFLAQASALLVLIINTVTFTFFQLPFLNSNTGIQLNRSTIFRKRGVWIYVSWAVAMTSWLAVIILEVVSFINVGYNVLLALYISGAVLAALVAIGRWQLFIAPRYSLGAE